MICTCRFAKPKPSPAGKANKNDASRKNKSNSTRLRVETAVAWLTDQSEAHLCAAGNGQGYARK